MWHHAQYRGEELIILGYNPRNNDCMLIRLSGLPMNEQSEIRKIAASRTAQQSNYLIPILQKMEAPNGSDWFSYLCKKMEQRNAPVFNLPLKEIQDSLDQDQKAIFKGYGKGRTNKALDVEDRSFDYSGNEHDTSAGEVSYAAQVAVPNAIEQKVDALVQSAQQTNAVLNRLVDALLADKQPSLAKKAKPAPRTRKPKPDLSKLGHNGGPALELNAD